MTTPAIPGIHHITAIAGDPQRNLDFYTTVLGLRLVKLTVNVDDPGTYHFYFGDEKGTAGSILTFFPWPDAPPRRRGIWARHRDHLCCTDRIAGVLAFPLVFLECIDVDPHIPLERVHESGEVFRRMNASVDERIYPRLGHTVTQDEIHAIQEVLRPRHAVVCERRSTHQRAVGA